MKVMRLRQEELDLFSWLDPYNFLDRLELGNGFALVVSFEDEEEGVDIPVGLLVAGVTTKRITIEWLCISPEYRSMGAGEALLNEIFSIAAKKGKSEVAARFIDGGIFADVETRGEEWFKERSFDKEDLLEYAGFSLSEKEGRNMVVTVGDLSKLDIVKKTRIPSYIKELGTLMMRPFRRGIMNCIFHTKRELLEDLSTLPMDWYEPEVSCYVETDDKINGLLLVHKTPSGLLRLELMSAFGPDSRVDLLHMVRFSILQAVKLYPEDTKVILPRRDESAKKLSQYFFPKGQGVPSLYGERREV